MASPEVGRGGNAESSARIVGNIFTVLIGAIVAILAVFTKGHLGNKERR